MKNEQLQNNKRIRKWYKKKKKKSKYIQANTGLL